MKVKFSGQKLMLAAFIVTLLVAFLRVHFRIQSTLIGYEIGDLKKREALLLQEKSQLHMELAKITTKKRLHKKPATEKKQQKR